MSRIIVLGAGRVGRVIARDLCEDPALQVTVADRDAGALADVKARCEVEVEVQEAELGDPAAVRAAVAGYDLAVGALPGALGYQTLEAVLESGIGRYVDISFLPEDPRPLAKRAAAQGTVVLYDMGVAPGMSNVLLAQGVRQLAPARSARYLVGGLPVVRRLPWEYEAPFSPIDVVEEYIRPARYRVGGKNEVRPALSDLEHFEFAELGTLEGFLTDGLRSLLDTVDPADCPRLEEKTLRYPGHAERVRVLRDSGFFDDREIRVGDQIVNARDFTFALLDPAWHQAEGSEELTLMRVEVEGEGGRRQVWELLDRTDGQRGETSMARTTGFPAALCARRLLDDEPPLPPGVHPPEALSGDDGLVAELLEEHARRGVRYRKLEG
jgi:saccharopine dehydrogenase-like NADP-dependent oxidoreductase